MCFKYWPNENRTAEFGKFLVETISEDAWDKDIVKRTFKLTNTKMVKNHSNNIMYLVLTASINV